MIPTACLWALPLTLPAPMVLSMPNAPSTFFAKITTVVSLSILLWSPSLAQSPSFTLPTSFGACSISFVEAFAELPDDATGGFIDEWDSPLADWASTARFIIERDALNRISVVSVDSLSATQSWERAFRILVSYASGRLSEEVVEVWDDDAGNWSIVQRTDRTYDNGQLAQTLTYTLNPLGGSLELSCRSTFTYAPAQTVEVRQLRTGAQWTNLERNTTSFAASGETGSILTETWNFITQTWTPAEQEEYTYTSSSGGTSSVEVLEQEWDLIDEQWVTAGLSITYRSDGRVTKITEERFENGTWVWEAQALYTYDNNQLSQILSQVYEGSQWMNEERVRMAYGVIPVELVNFRVRHDAGIVQLQWETASETNNSGFAIERRVGKTGSFETLGFVAGHGTTTAPQTYRFDDRGLRDVFGVLHYRLRQVDVDGSREYSPIVRVDLGPPTRLTFTSLGANPVSIPTRLSYTLPAESNVTLRLFNVLGQQVAELVNARQAAGAQHATLNPESLPSGLYFLQLKTARGVVTERVSVIR